MSFPDHPALARHLEGVTYPCGRAELLRHASAAGCGDDVLGPLGGLPRDDRYDDLDSVFSALDAIRAR
ncbi:DUF2795 domain-containing protein [Amycolatopsis carbonis]|uniref:DUF2795 domain-containing protein n=1 Tax=Amycolatopsis carbonis TaxID=715471 RepID=A0A9Y2IBG9_9PSEU|nr:DUF2795 domain-containing protein [Amycolatopsis sp. 2-15]WIX75921.1 DUF2795 domain-containing protein [Amycolatopsis sp. 2-15]